MIQFNIPSVYDVIKVYPKKVLQGTITEILRLKQLRFWLVDQKVRVQASAPPSCQSVGPLSKAINFLYSWGQTLCFDPEFLTSWELCNADVTMASSSS